MAPENISTLDPEAIDNKLDEARDNLKKSYMVKNFADQILPLGDFMDKLEAEIIEYALLISEMNQKKTAFLLGLNAPTLCEKMKKYNIKPTKSGRDKDLKKSVEEIAKFFSV
jgi:DNA-binding NtrC family response regulator